MKENKSKLVLVVDDDESSLAYTTKLVAMEGYQAISSTSGEEGIQTMREKEVDLLLLDQVMPTMNGIDTFERMKLVISEPPPVIMVTSHSSLELALVFMKNGGADFISKPLDKKVLGVKLQKALHQADVQKQANMARQAIYRCTLRSYKKLEEMVEYFLPALGEIIHMNVVLGKIEGDLYTVFDCSEKSDQLKPGMTFPLSKTYCSLVAKTKKPVFIRDVSKHHEWKAIDNEAMKGIVSYVAIPIYVQNELYGSLSATSNTVKMLDDQTIELIQLFGQRISQEIEMEKMQKEIEKQQKALLEAKTMSSMSRMTASIAHEIRQPLTAADVDLVMLGKVVDGGNIIEHVNSVRKKIAQALQTIRTMLKIYRNPIRDNPAKININNELENAVALFGHKSNGVKIIYDLPDQLIVMTAGNLSRIFVNIIGNALDVLKNNGQINISGKELKDSVLIAIEDTGPGINPDNMKIIFDPEYTTKKTGEGTGLGLWIARQEAERLGGTINVESKVGIFSRFTVTIPKNIPNKK